MIDIGQLRHHLVVVDDLLMDVRIVLLVKSFSCVGWSKIWGDSGVDRQQWCPTTYYCR